GHAPAIVFEDADVDTAIKVLSANKFRNAGQVCVSPTRFLVHETVYDRFVDGFTKFASSLKVGPAWRRKAAWVRWPTCAGSRRWKASSP
ncbi:aldehyde dehydrogenase family protein, partial [Salmonella enterica]|uniref:aldehyde dehydrogenase family protein n=1 Tax=Salmonella enterica TaxID=28901 RepID=UPI003D2C9C2B